MDREPTDEALRDLSKEVVALAALGRPLSGHLLAWGLLSGRGAMRGDPGHPSSQLREALDIVAFFVAVVVIVLFLSLDGIH